LEVRLDFFLVPDTTTKRECAGESVRSSRSQDRVAISLPHSERSTAVGCPMTPICPSTGPSTIHKTQQTQPVFCGAQWRAVEKKNSQLVENPSDCGGVKPGVVPRAPPPHAKGMRVSQALCVRTRTTARGPRKHRGLEGHHWSDLTPLAYFHLPEQRLAS
jgi:hypothetical protein